MKFLIDECCPLYLVEALRHDGHEVVYVPEVSPSITDTTVLEQAVASEQIIITEDHDFGELVFRQKLPSFGVILVRIAHTTSRDERVNRVRELLNSHAEQLPKHMITLTLDNIRVRPLPAQTK